MRYRDIINQMERSGHYSAARELEESIRKGSCSEYDRVRYREDACDGMSRYTYASNCAEHAFEEIRSQERYKEKQREEVEQQRREYEHQRRMAEERQQEQEFYEKQQQEEEEQQSSV